MAKKKPAPEEEGPRPFYFMNSYEFIWTGHEWHVKDLGSLWWMHLLNRYTRFLFGIYDEVGGVDSLFGTNRIEREILKCAKHPVFDFSPTPMFLRRWIDHWVELQYCCIWQHIFNTLRLKKGVPEVEAAARADQLAFQFEQLYEPTWPRYPKIQKPRRGSKRERK